ncbi:MAG: hypothetical protein HY670_04585 [Chloroflexi bacterium]|nr:hypothetical protein [Chloroflexota bacterium]
MFDNIDVVPAYDFFSRYLPKVTPKLSFQALRRLVWPDETLPLTTILEEGYIDVDYSSSYYMQAGRSFTPIQRSTTRVHFFDSGFDKRHFTSQTDCSSLAANYLGYIVIRPGTTQTIGRTFIRGPHYLQGAQVYLPTAANFAANLCGFELEIKNACPFLSQDQMVLACATASLWMASTPLARKLRGTIDYTTSDITSLALAIPRPFSPSLGSRGLRLDEMERALVCMGYDPKMCQYPEPASLFHICHVYLESGLAPILALEIPDGQQVAGVKIGPGLHAVTVVGHSFDTRARDGLCNPIYKDLYPSSAFVPNLIVHDDQCGPYLTARISEPMPQFSQAPNPYRAQMTIDVDGGHYEAYCKAVLIPLPGRVMLDGCQAALQSAVFLDDLRGNGALDPKPLILRTLLVGSNHYKADLFTGRPDMPPELKEVYRSLPMPRFIWLVEFGYLDQWDNASLDHLNVVGELILV